MIRSSPVYGAGSDKPKFISNFIVKALRSEPILTHSYLNGDARLDLLHIDDFVDVIVRTCTQGYEGVINVGTGITTSTNFIAEMLTKELGSSSQIQKNQIESYSAFIAMNNEKARQVLGWQPQVKLQDGLKGLLLDKSLG